ncbi:MAG TPA: AAA family ATPase [Acidimicrobiales bacterium]|nr:AAA family ATPase [Acidimicrobiales bacterium]
MIVGRAAELRRVTAFTEALRAGHGGTLVLRGEPGIGKTVLARAATATDVRSVLVTCVDHEVGTAYATLHDVVAPLRAHVADLPAPQARALRVVLAEDDGPPPSPLGLGVATLGLLAAAAAEAPTLLVVDDLHWADQPSADALLFAARRLADEAVGVMLVVRDVESRDLDLAAFEVLDLVGLDVVAAAAVVEEGAGARPVAAVAAELVARTGGNPFALVEAAVDLSPDQIRGAEPLPDDIGAGWVERIARSRLDRLDPVVRHGLRLAACSRTDDVSELSAAIELMEHPAGLLVDLEATGLIEVVDGRVGFRHPLVREACRQGDPAELRQCHGALAAVSTGDTRTWHRAAATVGVDESVAEAMTDVAGRLRLGGANLDAARAFDRAAALSPDIAARARRRCAAGRAYQSAGEWDLADERLLSAWRDGDEAVRAEAQRARGFIRLWSGRRDEGRRLLFAEAERLADRSPASAAGLVLDAMVAFVHDGQIAEAATVAERARELAADVGGVTAALARAYTGYFRALAGDHTSEGDVIDGSRAVVDLGWEAAAAVVGFDGVAYLGLMLDHVEALDDACALLDDVIAAARRSGAAGALPVALSHRADVLTRQGKWRAALLDADESLQYAAVTGQRTHWAYGRVRQLMVEAMTAAEPDPLWGELVAFHAEATELGLAPVMGETARAGGLLHLGAGDPATAAWAFGELAVGCELAGMLHPGGIPHLADLVEARLRIGDLEGATAALGTLRARAAPLHGGWHRAALARVEGLLADDVDALRHAVDLHVGLGMPFELARALLDLGRTLRRLQQPVDSRAPLHEALRLFEHMGARAWAATASSELRAARGRVSAGGEPTAGLDVLTPQEERIATLVAAGATNKEVAAELFVAPKTVENCLSRVYAKLGVRSRTQLAAAVSRRA